MGTFRKSKTRTCSDHSRPVVVVGAGVVGVMTAYALYRRGLHVVLIDSLDGPAQMCSFGNAGIMAVGHADAWASPRAIRTMARAFIGREPSVQLTRLWDPALWSWGVSFLQNCTTAAHRENTDRLKRLSLFSRNMLLETETALGLPKETRHDGGLYIFQDTSQYEIRSAGLECDDLEVLSRNSLVEMEPSLAKMGERLKGGVFSHVDSVGDCRLFTQRAVKAMAGSKRLEMRFGHKVTGLRHSAGRVTAVGTDKGPIACSKVVLATGVETAQLTRPLGFAPKIYPVKGYSGTWIILDPRGVPTLPFVDETELLAVATYGDRLRVTAIAEFAGLDRSLPSSRTKMLGDYVLRTFGDAVDHEEVEYWAGLRPSTPSGPPYLGRAKAYDNLWINAGHGQLGWTMSFGCGELLAQAMEGSTLAQRNVSAMAGWLDPV